MLFSDGVWYEGMIEKYSARSDRYTIKFPDGDVQTAKLPDKDVRIVGMSAVTAPVSVASASHGESGRGRQQMTVGTVPKKSPKVELESLSSKKKVKTGVEDQSQESKSLGAAHGADANNHEASQRRVSGTGHKHSKASDIDGSQAAENATGRSSRRLKAEDVNFSSDVDESTEVSRNDVDLEHVVLSDCLDMLDRLLAMRGGNYFAEPVDAEALGLPDYHEIVTEPMDFSTIKERLLSGFYCARPKGKGKAAAQVFSDKDGVKMRKAFGRDVRKVLDNAMLYNPESDRVYKAAASILEVFKSEWQVDQWESHAEQDSISSPVDKADKVETAKFTTPTNRTIRGKAATSSSRAALNNKSGKMEAAVQSLSNENDVEMPKAEAVSTESKQRRRSRNGDS